VGVRVPHVIRAVIYTRVSQDRGAGKRSVGEQEAECRTVAIDNGWTVVKVFTDNDRSASRYAKKARDRLIHAHTVQSASGEHVRRAGAPRSCLASLFV
jgi:DNA invertase Pin-like site-specific DNA recombinase